MKEPGSPDNALMSLVRRIAAADTATAVELIGASPALARVSFQQGAARQTAESYHLGEIGYYIYQGDAALHIAAAAYQREVVKALLASGADVCARNRRGAEPLHAASSGRPGSSAWNPQAQAATVACLVAAGADPNAADRGGATPLHRAVRTRCAAAVAALHKGGADAQAKNKSGSTPAKLAKLNIGRGGPGSPEAKAQQSKILRLLKSHRPEPP
jgi:ankyrin repeat protein